MADCVYLSLSSIPTINSEIKGNLGRKGEDMAHIS